MARYYFHIRDGDRLIRDDEGIERPSLGAARAEAILVTREAVRLATLRGERIGMHGVFEIADQSGQTGLAIAPEQIALVLPPRKRSLFYKIVAPLLRSTSRIRSRKALAVAFHMIGIHSDTIEISWVMSIVQFGVW